MTGLAGDVRMATFLPVAKSLSVSPTVFVTIADGPCRIAVIRGRHGKRADIGPPLLLRRVAGQRGGHVYTVTVALIALEMY